MHPWKTKIFIFTVADTNKTFTFKRNITVGTSFCKSWENVVSLETAIKNSKIKSELISDVQVSPEHKHVIVD
jgi:hypothetical protein